MVNALVAHYEHNGQVGHCWQDCYLGKPDALKVMRVSASTQELIWAMGSGGELKSPLAQVQSAQGWS